MHLSFLSNLINGISLGSVYAIIALGYTMVYGIAKMLNFAHGDVIMIGAYISFCVTQYLKLPAWLSVLAAMFVCTLLGMTIERLAYKPLRSAPSLAVLITAIGMSYLLQNLALLIWGSNPKSFTSIISFGPVRLFDGQLIISDVAIVTVLACILIMLALTWFTGKTRMGKAMRAVSEDKGAAQLMGINVNATISLTFAIGSGLAAVAALFCGLPRCTVMYWGMNTLCSTRGCVAQVESGAGPLAEPPRMAGAGMVVCRMSCWALREVEPVSAVTAVGETAWEEKIGSMLMGAYASTPEYTCTPSRRMSE